MMVSHLYRGYRLNFEHYMHAFCTCVVQAFVASDVAFQLPHDPIASRSRHRCLVLTHDICMHDSPVHVLDVASAWHPEICMVILLWHQNPEMNSAPLRIQEMPRLQGSTYLEESTRRDLHQNLHRAVYLWISNSRTSASLLQLGEGQRERYSHRHTHRHTDTHTHTHTHTLTHMHMVCVRRPEHLASDAKSAGG